MHACIFPKIFHISRMCLQHHISQVICMYSAFHLSFLSWMSRWNEKKLLYSYGMKSTFFFIMLPFIFLILLSVCVKKEKFNFIEMNSTKKILCIKWGQMNFNSTKNTFISLFFSKNNKNWYKSYSEVNDIEENLTCTIIVWLRDGVSFRGCKCEAI